MALLSSAEWPPLRVAEHLDCHPHTVRAGLKGFATWGQGVLPRRPGPGPGSGPGHDRRAQVTGRLAGSLGQDRTWTARQLAEVLGPDIGIGHHQVRRCLSLMRAGYRRTA